jgi:hypothetical protein
MLDGPGVHTPLERKMRIIYSMSLFCFLISCVLSLQFPAAVDKRIRKTLLDVLKRFHRNDFPNDLVLNLDHEVMLEMLPNEVMAETVGSFMDFKSIAALRMVNTKSVKISHSIVKCCLFNFSPYFLFDDLFLNDLLLYVLDEHFPESSNLSSPFIKDELQVLIVKFNYDYLNYDAIPRNIYFYLISFINEFVNGPNSTIPITKESCKIDSIRFMTQNESPKTLEIIKNLQKPTFDSYIDNLEFFAGRPTKEDVATNFEITDINVWWRQSRSMDSEFLLIISEYFVENFTTEELMSFCKDAAYAPNSLIIIDHLLSVVSRYEFTDFARKGFVIDSRYSLCVRYSDSRPDRELILKKVINELPLEDTSAMETSLILTDPSNIKAVLLHFSVSYSFSNLYQAELFSICINSPHISVETRSNYFVHSFDSRFIFWDMTLKENPRPFNMFKVFPYTDTFVSLNIIHRADHVTLSIFFELLNSKDPIGLLFMLSRKCLIASRLNILDKFDLNKSYHFGMAIRKYDINFNRFIGRTLHFKQIIKELNDPELKNVFSSNPHEFDGEFLPSGSVILIDSNFGAEYFTGW